MRAKLVLTALLLTAISASTQALAERPLTDNDALERLSRQSEARFNLMRGPAYERLKAMTTGPMGVLNADPEIELIGVDARGRPWFYMVHNLNAAYTTNTATLWPGGNSGYNLTGANTGPGELAIWDGGKARATHQEFGGRVLYGDVGEDVHDHATHVAGTMVAAGIYPDAHGMSPEAVIVSYDWDNDNAEMATATVEGLQISNHSYGWITGWYQSGEDWYWYGDTQVDEQEDYGFGFYSYSTQDGGAGLWDEFVYNAPYYLICKSAGNDRGTSGPLESDSLGHYFWNNAEGEWEWIVNVTRDRDGGLDGFDCVSWFGTAKNIITVGAARDIPEGYKVPSDVIMTYYSCWGPTDDGRIKPDLVANGYGLYSPVGGSDMDYDNISGTSMAAPNLSGSLNLLVDFYEQTHRLERPLASTMKALLIHTADEAGDTLGPDYRFGWGLLNTGRAADMINDDAAMLFPIQEYELVAQDTHRVSYEKTEDGPVKVTIAWTDPPGTPVIPQVDPPDLMLVNDLDLRVILLDMTDQDSVAYEPWVLDPSRPDSTVYTGDNFRDNIEQVFIDTAAAGKYKIEITHKNTVLTGLDADDTTQVYSLIISGLNLTGDTRVSPTTLSASLTDIATGAVDLHWVFESPAPAGFEQFRVYRNNELVMVATDTFATDTMETFGENLYEIVAYFTDIGESTPTNVASILWPEPAPPNYVERTNRNVDALEITLAWKHFRDERLAYDDKTAENWLAFEVGDPGDHVFAQRFTASTAGNVLQVGANLGWAIHFTGENVIPYDSTLMKFAVYGQGVGENEFGDLLFESEPFFTDFENWVWLNLFDTNVAVGEGEDFWVALSALTPGYTSVGIDLDGPKFARSMFSTDGGATLAQLPGTSFGNLLIRARVGIQEDEAVNGFTGFEIYRDGQLTGPPQSGLSYDETMPDQEIHFYNVAAVYQQGVALSDPLWVNGATLGVRGDPALPMVFEIGKAYPNPFNPAIAVPVRLGQAAYVNIEVYNLLGRKVGTVATGRYEAGAHRFIWNARNLASGVYFLKVQAGPERMVQKVMLIR